MNQIEALRKYTSDIYYNAINRCMKYGVDFSRMLSSIKTE